MIKKKVFIVVVAALLAIVVIQALIILRPFEGRHSVMTEEDAILIAKAELVRRYGAGEIRGMEFVACEGDRFWHVYEVVGIIEINGIRIPRMQLGYPRRVDVRISDGRAFSLWSDGLWRYLDIIRQNWF